MKDPELKVIRCVDCGDTFTVHADEEEITCPSCGSTALEPASEPFL